MMLKKSTRFFVVSLLAVAPTLTAAIPMPLAAIRVPEPGGLEIWGVGLIAVTAIALFLKRRIGLRTSH